MKNLSARLSSSGAAKFATACAFSFLANIAGAAPVSINFDAMPEGIYPSNFATQGITFSPSCHYDILSTPDIWLGFDGSGCSDGSPAKNPDYRGPEVGEFARLYIAAGAGNVLALQSLKFMTIDPFSGGFHIHSSNGGLAILDWAGGNASIYNFSGPEWVNLEWLVFSTSVGEPVGFDDLELQVHQIDEPGSPALFGLCLLGLAGLRRQRRPSFQHPMH